MVRFPEMDLSSDVVRSMLMDLSDALVRSDNVDLSVVMVLSCDLDFYQLGSSLWTCSLSANSKTYGAGASAPNSTSYQI